MQKNSIYQNVSIQTFEGLPINSQVTQINIFTQKGVTTDGNGKLLVYVPNGVNSIFIGDKIYEYADGTYTNPTEKPYEELKFKININGTDKEVTFGTVLEDGYIYTDVNGNIFYPGEKIGTNLKGYAAVKKDNAWYYNASDAENLKTFAAIVNKETENEFKDASNPKYLNCLMTSDIDLNNEEWTAINEYRGIFDGNGHKILNFKYTGSGQSGFIKTLLYGTMKNLGMVNIDMTVTDLGKYDGAGAIIGYNFGKVINCFTSGNININVSGKGQCYDNLVGGIGSGGEIYNCYTTGNKLCGNKFSIYNSYYLDTSETDEADGTTFKT